MSTSCAIFVEKRSSCKTTVSVEAVLSAGVTYEWDIFGWWSDGNDPGNSENVDPPYFFKEETAHDSRYRSIYSESYSFSDSYEDGMDALNGWFELIAE